MTVRPMKLAFALFHYFPYGGLERDMLTMAQECQRRGHDVTIYTGDWQGPRPGDMHIEVLPSRGWSNAAKNGSFVRQLTRRLQREPGTVVVGFNRMPGLNVYYAADVCFAIKAWHERGPFYRMTPRARQYLAHEKAVFDPAAKTHVLMISRDEAKRYQDFYHTPDERIHLLPPGIRRDRVMPEDYATRRPALRKKFAIADDEFLLLMVGSDFRRKGLDRVLQAVAALAPEKRRAVRLWAIGQDDPAPYVQLARKLGIDDQVEIFPGRDDISEVMWSADALLHPAYTEAAGMVLLEGLVAGLPVLVTPVCGYAHYIADSGMGAVLPDPFDAGQMARQIEQVLAQPRDAWVARSRAFVSENDIFSLSERAANLIESLWGNA